MTFGPVCLAPHGPVGGHKVGDSLFSLFGTGSHRSKFIAVAQLFHEGQEPVDFVLHGGTVRLRFLFSGIGSFLGGYRALLPTGGRLIGPLKFIARLFNLVLETRVRSPVIFQSCEQQVYEFLLFHFSKVGAASRRGGGKKPCSSCTMTGCSFLWEALPPCSGRKNSRNLRCCT